MLLCVSIGFLTAVSDDCLTPVELKMIVSIRSHGIYYTN
jgi:hypothetical protein